eukprot:4975392-Amphidinium_carterae.1
MWRRRLQAYPKHWRGPCKPLAVEPTRTAERRTLTNVKGLAQPQRYTTQRQSLQFGWVAPRAARSVSQRCFKAGCGVGPGHGGECRWGGSRAIAPDSVRTEPIGCSTGSLSNFIAEQLCTVLMSLKG